MNHSPRASGDPEYMHEDASRVNQRLAIAGQFSLAIMHEINNPLEAISNLNYLIQHDSGDLERIRHFSRLLEEQLALVVQIVNQTLSYSRSADTSQVTDMASLADAALRVHQKKITGKQIRVRKNLPRDTTVQAHAGEMLQVLSNLIAKAMDALPENGTLCVKVSSSPRGVHVVIADDGHGIPKDILPKIFDPFFTTMRERGVGIGLAISKAIVEKHRGRIRGRSSTRMGRSETTFRISLPTHGSSL